MEKRLRMPVASLAARAIAFDLEVRHEASGLGVRDLRPYLSEAAHVIVVGNVSYPFRHHYGETVFGAEIDASQPQQGFWPYIGFEHLSDEADGADGQTRTASWIVDPRDPRGEPDAREHCPPQFKTVAASTVNQGRQHLAIGEVSVDSASGRGR